MRRLTFPLSLTALTLSLAACSVNFSGKEDDEQNQPDVMATSETAHTAGGADIDLLSDGMSSMETLEQSTGNQTVPLDDFEAPEFMQLQVVLDEMGLSPGIIDGKMGMSTKNALTAFQEQNGIKVTGNYDELTKTVLKSKMRRQATRLVKLPAAYASLSFEKNPEGAEAKAKAEKLGYESLWEKLAERFHTTEEVLLTLNPELKNNGGNTPSTNVKSAPSDEKATDAKTANTGLPEELTENTQLRVPNIGADKITRGSIDNRDWEATLIALGVGSDQPNAAKIVVDKSDGMMRVFNADDKLIAAFTATMGSKRDPLPLGNWKITAVAHNPPFSYDPKLLWDVPDDKAKLQLPPGPNGPVGVVWIDLTKEHYGIHGTPDPATIGRAQSHGCVRLTNWDAARLAQMVSGETKVLFQA